MLKALRTSRLISLLPLKAQHQPLKPFTPFLSTSLRFSFSEHMQPRNKEEAFQMQEQQRLKMKPEEEE